MGIFNEFHKKEKPHFTGIARGLGGFGFGKAAAAAAGGAAESPIEASGGVIHEYDDGGTKYRSHIFTTPGTFTYTTATPSNLQYMVIGGGGSGGSYNGGGGGSGSVTSNHPDMPAPLKGAVLPISGPTSYTVTVGRGGSASHGGPPSFSSAVGNPANVYPFAQADFQEQGRLGENSSLGPTIVARGGGGGGGYNGGSGNPARQPGGSGGGAAYGGTAGSGDKYTPNPSPVGPGAGNAGGDGYASPQYAGGGGGGAGGAGDPGSPGTSDNSWGGIGLRIRIAGGDNPTYTTTGYRGPGGTYQWYAGGGGGGRYNDGATGGGGPSNAYPIGYAGAGKGGGPTGVDGLNGIQGTGSGGGGGGDGASLSGTGGSGIVVVRYQIPATSGTAKATGGNISFYNNKTIHTFLQPGTFTVGGSNITNAEIVIVGGGGGSGGESTGALYGTGGGGAGEVLITPPSSLQTLPSSTPYTVTVGQGGAGGQSYPGRNAGSQGESSVFGSVTAAGGGGGGGGGNGGAGGSGGGGTQFGGSSGGAAGPKTAPSDYTSYKNAGGNGVQTQGSGGGGGAGGVGQNANPQAGSGGLGIQLPTTFQDPLQDIGMPGPGGTKFWIGGGGGGARYAGTTNPGTNGGTGPARDTGGPFAGGGNSGVGPVPATYLGNQGAEGWANTGGGAGGCQTSGANPPNYPGVPGARGGSGLVLIAYPT